MRNRTAFTDALERAFRNVGPEGRFAVLFLDLDRFKVINDTLGHMAGDAVLRETASRVLRAVRSRDVVARLGGDEFAVLAERLSTPEEALDLASRLRTELNRPIDAGGRKFALSASVGIKIAGTGGTPKDVLRDADTAMYCAKANSRGSQQLFEDAMHARLIQDVQTENDLRAGLESEQLHMRYQPIVRLRDGAIAGFEAVLAWEAPTGVWPPEDYAQVANNSDLSVRLGWTALRQALLAAGGSSATALLLPLPLAPQLLHQTDFLRATRCDGA
ncbi:MAG: diguanylate cyclase [Bryobacterales bacterium]